MHSVNRQKFTLDRFILKPKAPSIVRSSVWTAVLNRINTNDLLQIVKPKTAIFHNICVMCMKILNQLHAFLIANSLWIRVGLFELSGDFFLSIRFKGFGRRKQVKVLWNYAFFAIFWCICLDRNAQIFQGLLVSLEMLWDR